MSKPINFKYSNTLINTRQPIVNIKGTNTDNNMEPVSVGIVGGMSRPNVNLGHAPSTSPEVNYNNARNFIGPFAKAYTIKTLEASINFKWKELLIVLLLLVLLIDQEELYLGDIQKKDVIVMLVEIIFTLHMIINFFQSDNKSIKPSGTINILPGTVNNKVQNNGGIQIGPVWWKRKL